MQQSQARCHTDVLCETHFIPFILHQSHLLSLLSLWTLDQYQSVQSRPLPCLQVEMLGTGQQFIEGSLFIGMMESLNAGVSYQS